MVIIRLFCFYVDSVQLISLCIFFMLAYVLSIARHADDFLQLNQYNNCRHVKVLLCSGTMAIHCNYLSVINKLDHLINTSTQNSRDRDADLCGYLPYTVVSCRVLIKKGWLTQGSKLRGAEGQNAPKLSPNAPRLLNLGAKFCYPIQADIWFEA